MIYEWRDIRAEDEAVLITWVSDTPDPGTPWHPYGLERPTGHWSRQLKVDGVWVTKMHVARDGDSWGAWKVHG